MKPFGVSREDVVQGEPLGRTLFFPVRLHPEFRTRTVCTETESDF